MTTTPELDLVLWLIETLVKSMLVIGIAAIIATWLRRRLPSASHFIWILGFVAVAALPLASRFVPSSTIIRVDPVALSPSDDSTVEPGIVRAQSFTVPSTGPTPQLATDVNNATRVGSKLRDSHRFPIWFEWAVALWLIGFLAILARSLFGLHSLRLIRKYGTHSISSEPLAYRLDQLAETAGVKRSWDLRISATSELALPMTWGVVRPTIVLPQDADHWPPKQFEAVMLHELAHVRRYDFLSQLVAEAVCAIYWFNPMVWLGARAMRSDAELAADEAVLQTGLKPSEYASELLKLAAKLGNRKQAFAYVGTPAMNNSKIETRLESVLKYPAGRRGITSIQALVACAAATIAIPALASLHAQSQASATQGQVAGNTAQASNDPETARNKLKQVGLASLMYSNDYDGVFPYVQQTASAVQVLMPYTKNKDLFVSPTPGGQFLFNMNVGGVLMTAFPEPAQTPMWYESVKGSKLPALVAFSEGHVKELDLDALKTRLGWKFPRTKASKPLPGNYLLPIKP